MWNDLNMPSGYQWLIEHNLVGFEPFTQLQPWHYISCEQRFWATERWPDVSKGELFVFARRQDNDDLACISFDCNKMPNGVVEIQGWTESGFDIIQEFPDFWLWMEQVVRDISMWASLK